MKFLCFSSNSQVLFPYGFLFQYYYEAMATIKIHLNYRRAKKDGTYPLAENGWT
jgi:hypothetical protein